MCEAHDRSDTFYVHTDTGSSAAPLSLSPKVRAHPGVNRDMDASPVASPTGPGTLGLPCSAGARPPATYPQNQLLGGRGHEDAVTPGRAAGVHVLLPLARVLAVWIAGETEPRPVITARCPPPPDPSSTSQGEGCVGSFPAH